MTSVFLESNEVVDAATGTVVRLNATRDRTDKRGRESEITSCEKTYQCRKSLKGNPKITVVVNGNARIVSNFNSTNTCAISGNLSRKPRRLLENISSTTSNRHKAKRCRVTRGIRQQDSRAKNVPRMPADVTSVGSARIADSLGADLKSTDDVNYAVLQSNCVKCMAEPLKKDSKCTICGSRWARCRVVHVDCILPF